MRYEKSIIFYKYPSYYFQAIENFKTMFPGVPEDIIIDLMRRENGDVDKVVNELLAFSTNPVSPFFVLEKEITRTSVPLITFFNLFRNIKKSFDRFFRHFL